MSKRLIAKRSLTPDGERVYLVQVVYDQDGRPRTESFLDEPVPVDEADAQIVALQSTGDFHGVWEGPLP